MNIPNKNELTRIYGEAEKSAARFQAVADHFAEIYHHDIAEFFTAPPVIPSTQKFCMIINRIEIGMEFEEPIKELRQRLLFEQKVFTGVSGTNVIRLLPPLCLTMAEADEFLERFRKVLV